MYIRIKGIELWCSRYWGGWGYDKDFVSSCGCIIYNVGFLGVTILSPECRGYDHEE